MATAWEAIPIESVDLPEEERWARLNPLCFVGRCVEGPANKTMIHIDNEWENKANTRFRINCQTMR